MKMKLFLALAITSAAMLTSCKKDTPTTTPLTGKTFTIDGTVKKWIYFSFEKNDTVLISNPKTSTDWDLAFNRFLIRTNSGLSGSGLSGADSTLLKESTGYDSYKTAVDTALKVDKIMQVMTQGAFANDTVNPVLYNWFNYNYGTNKLEARNQVFVIKTAKGKYAKLIITSYYKGTASKFLTFSYVYQPNGTKSLQ